MGFVSKPCSQGGGGGVEEQNSQQFIIYSEFLRNLKILFLRDHLNQNIMYEVKLITFYAPFKIVPKMGTLVTKGLTSCKMKFANIIGIFQRKF